MKAILFTLMALTAFPVCADNELRTISKGTKFQCSSTVSVAKLRKKISGFPVLCNVKSDVVSTISHQTVIPSNSRLLGWTDNGTVTWTSWQTPNGKLVEGFAGLASRLKSKKNALMVIATHDVQIWF